MQKPVLIPLGQLQPSPTNPRKTFDAGKLRELAENIAQHGVLQALLVRPAWCQGCRTAAEIDARRTDAVQAPFEIVDGERRYRSMQIIMSEEHADDAARRELPCDVRELTDTQVVEIQLITFITKEPLTALEEARGFADLLKLKNDKGEPLHTRESIARAVGRHSQYVHRHLKLLKLEEFAQKALESGRIGTALASMIARIPHKEEREKAARAIIGPDGGDPMSEREARRYIAENFMQVLAGAPFDVADAKLPGPNNGEPLSCEACPHRTGNSKELYFEGDEKKWRGDVCTLPACYRAKCQVVFDRTSAAAVAEDKSVKVLEAKAAEDIFSAHDKVSLRFDTSYVDLHEKPAEAFVRHEVDRAKLPTWEALTEGRDVPRCLIQDGAGRMRILVDRNLAIGAAIENGEDIFVAGLGAKRPTAGAGKDKRAEAEQKKQLEVACASSVAMRRAIIAKTSVAEWSDGEGLVLPDMAIEPLWDLVVECVGADAVWFALKSLEVIKAAHETSEQTYMKVRQRVTDNREMLALLVELLYGRQLRYNGPAKCEPFGVLAEVYGVDLKAVAKEALAEKKAPERAPQPRDSAVTKAPPTRGPIVMKGSVRGGETVAEERYLAAKTLLVAGKSENATAKQLGLTKGQMVTVLEHMQGDAPKAEEKKAPAKKSSAGAAQMGLPGVGGGSLADRKARSELPRKERVQEVRRMVESGMTALNIAVEMGLSLRWVGDTLEKLGFEGPGPWSATSQPATPPTKKPKPAKPTAAEVEQRVRELRAKGQTLTEIYLATHMARGPLKKLLAVIDAEKGGKK